MKKALIFLLFSFSFIGYGLAQKSQSQVGKKDSELSVKIICTAGPIPTPLYILRYKKEDYILDTAKLKYIHPADVKRIKVLKKKADLDKYEDKGKNGVVIIETNKPLMDLFLEIED